MIQSLLPFAILAGAIALFALVLMAGRRKGSERTSPEPYRSRNEFVEEAEEAGVDDLLERARLGLPSAPKNRLIGRPTPGRWIRLATTGELRMVACRSKSIRDGWIVIGPRLTLETWTEDFLSEAWPSPGEWWEFRGACPSHGDLGLDLADQIGSLRQASLRPRKTSLSEALTGLPEKDRFIYEKVAEGPLQEDVLPLVGCCVVPVNFGRGSDIGSPLTEPTADALEDFLERTLRHFGAGDSEERR